MATWDSADCLARLKKLLRRPATDEADTDPELYRRLTEAQQYWMRELAAHIPESQYGAPTKLLTADSGETYQFPDLYHAGYDADNPPAGETADSVIMCEIYARKDGWLWRAGAYWDDGADYVFEGNQIRFPRGKSKTVTNGPYARYAQEPPDISGSVEPKLQPPFARALIVARAAAIWATEGGFLDPQPYHNYENRIAFGEPGGTGGILAQMKAGEVFGGQVAYPATDSAWWRSIDTGGYVP